MSLDSIDRYYTSKILKIPTIVVGYKDDGYVIIEDDGTGRRKLISKQDLWESVKTAQDYPSRPSRIETDDSSPSGL